MTDTPAVKQVIISIKPCSRALPTGHCHRWRGHDDRQQRQPGAR